MKKTITFLLTGLLCFTINSKAQATYFGTDVVIQNKPSDKQTSVKLASAFNGWLYSAIQYSNSANDSNGVYFRYSKDKGFTWKTIANYKLANTSATYDDIEIVVAGTDTNSLQLFVSAIRRNNSTNYVLFIDKYNARTGSFLGVLYTLQNTTRIYDLAMATDYMYPASGTTGYSVGLLYSKFGSPVDSIVYVASIDGGATMSVRQTVATTSSFFRKVSLSYGRGASGSNGRYFGVWERLATSVSRNGNIYAARSASTVSGAWNAPKNLDSLSTTMIGLCRNPRVMTSSGTVDNDSLGVSEIVLVERDFGGTGTDYDLLGFFNNRAHFTNFWYRFDVKNNSSNHLHPDVAYHDSVRAFLVSYYDSTAGQLNYESHSFNMNTGNASTWTLVKTGYNDVPAGPMPVTRIAYNPKEKRLAAAWIKESSTNPTALFDSEYNLIYSNLTTATAKSFTINVFPNPAKDYLNLSLNLDKATQIAIELIDMTGKSILRNDYGRIAGEQTLRLDFSDLKKGLYVLQVKSNAETVAYKINIE